jgi:hypothetical protein
MTRLMMNDDLQDECEEHSSVEEQVTLSLDGLHGLKNGTNVRNHCCYLSFVSENLSFNC